MAGYGATSVDGGASGNGRVPAAAERCGRNGRGGADLPEDFESGTVEVRDFFLGEVRDEDVPSTSGLFF